MPRRVYDKNSGKMVWVGDDGKPLVNYNPGMGSLPGQALRREADLLSRLPDAQLAGFVGPSVVNPTSMRGVRPNDPDPTPPQTYRPLAGAKQQNRGGSVVLILDGNTPSQQVSSVVETPRSSGDDAEVISVVLGAYPEQDLVSPVVAPIPNPAQIPIFATAIVEWGIGGATFSAEVDWDIGTRFDLLASFIRIGLQVDANTLAPALPFKAVFSAALGYGAPGGSAFTRARRTISIGTGGVPGSIEAGDVSGIFVIPPFARSVTLLSSSSIVNARLFVGKYASGGPTPSESVTFDVVNKTNAARQDENQFPLQGGARFIAVQNIGVGSLNNPLLVFALGL